MPLLDQAPFDLRGVPLGEGLLAAWQKQVERWCDKTTDEHQACLDAWLGDADERLAQLTQVWVASDYVCQQALDRPDDFLAFLEADYPAKAMPLELMRADLNARLEEVEGDEKVFDRTLRVFRRHMMMRILWRDFCRSVELLDTTGDMTSMAEVTIQAAISFHYEQLGQRFGRPIGKTSGQTQPLVVLGMGKLGGCELNVSSDIDLIFAYPESGVTQGGRKEISNQEYFIKLGQKVINSLDTTRMDGFVFRVDMRLRPYGQSGSLVLNFDAMEEYYQTQGRDWERYAMIKARIVSGDVMGGAEAGEQLMQMLRPFTYRKYVDFSAIESMRAMKALINREVQRRGISSDVKLGAGGIREVEFVVQVFQMIRGGRDIRLHERQLLKLLPLLNDEGLLPESVASQLADAYVFLRNTEHTIQGYQDKQSQSLPVDEFDQQRLAWVMGFDDWSGFLQVLNLHRERVNECFQNVIAEPAEVNSSAVAANCGEWEPLWLDELSVDEGLGDKGLSGAEQAAQALLSLKRSRALTSMQEEGRQRLNALMPRLFAALLERHQQGECQDCGDTLQRILVLIEKVARRTAYILLLVENPNALKQLVRLCSASSWIADELANHPALLDELLDQASLYNPPNKDELRDELRQQVLRVGWDDLDGQMETLRYFRQAHALKVAASEVTEVLPLMKVSDYLTWLAEVILEHVMALAWQQMVERHGRPGHKEGEAPPEFIVVGYGKMGGVELGYNSDLDLVFMHNANGNLVTSGREIDGAKQIDNQTFFTRLGQKMIHILNTQTVSGQLYEVDMRLRPSGNSGLLVSSLKAFEKYQQEEAWTWEHQALTRARVVAGAAGLAAEFDRVRDGILSRERDVQKLKADVVAMRQKMREHLGTKTSEQNQKFDLKQDAGGIVDIEFLVQYGVLAWGHKTPGLTEYSDNVRILEVLGHSGLFEYSEAEALSEAYKIYRSAGHRLALQRQKGVVSADEYRKQREQVIAIWNKYLS